MRYILFSILKCNFRYPLDTEKSDENESQFYLMSLAMDSPTYDACRQGKTQAVKGKVPCVPNFSNMKKQ